MFYVTIAGLRTVLDKVVEYLGLPEVVEEGRKCLKAYLEEKYGGWKEIVRKGVEWGIEAALSALKAVKEEIVKVCRKYEPLIVQLTKLGVKSGARIATETGVKTLTKHTIRAATKTATKSAVKEATKAAPKFIVKGTTMTFAKSTAKETAKAAVKEVSAVSSKALFKAANPVGVVADVAQAGLELAGQEEAGKVVGIGGNIISGVMMGGAIGGPPGAVIGAGFGFALWATGEVAGGVTGRFIDWLSGPS